MTRIDFYQIESEEAPLAFTCRLIDKIYRLGHQIYVHASSGEEASALDELLWSFREESFVPHALAGGNQSAPIRIGHDHEPDDHQEVLVNLSGKVPDFFSRFDRVAEVVPQNENRRESARENFRFYRDRGYPLEYHNMNARTNG